MSVPLKVSVMVPTYNAKDFVEEALKSILEQDYPNLEVVVCDDASTDGTQEIIKAYKARHPEKMVVRLNELNLGIAKNCNQCLDLCSGELVALFAGDDIMLPSKLSKQVRLFEDEPDLVMVYHPVEIFDSESNATLYVTNQVAREDTNSATAIIRKMGVAGGMSLMVRRSAIPAGGYDENLPYASDWLFHIEIAMKGRVQKLNEVLCRYRKYGTNNGKSLASYLHEFEKVLDVVEAKYGANNSDIVAACRAGRARFYAGEGFRKMAADRRQARQLFGRAIGLQPLSLKYYFAYALATNTPTAMASIRLKSFLKRWVS